MLMSGHALKEAVGEKAAKDKRGVLPNHDAFAGAMAERVCNAQTGTC